MRPVSGAYRTCFPGKPWRKQKGDGCARFGAKKKLPIFSFNAIVVVRNKCHFNKRLKAFHFDLLTPFGYRFQSQQQRPWRLIVSISIHT